MNYFKLILNETRRNIYVHLLKIQKHPNICFETNHLCWFILETIGWNLTGLSSVNEPRFLQSPIILTPYRLPVTSSQLDKCVSWSNRKLQVKHSSRVEHERVPIQHVVIRASLIGSVLCATSLTRGNHGRAHVLCSRDSTQERITLQRETTDASGDRLPHNGVIDQQNVSFGSIEGREIPVGSHTRSRLLCTVPWIDSFRCKSNRIAVECRPESVRAYCSRDYLLIGRWKSLSPLPDALFQWFWSTMWRIV